MKNNKLYTLVFHDENGNWLATIKTDRTIMIKGWMCDKENKPFRDAYRCYVFIGSDCIETVTRQDD